jgi:hypothetical protein
MSTDAILLEDLEMNEEEEYEVIKSGSIPVEFQVHGTLINFG